MTNSNNDLDFNLYSCTFVSIPLTHPKRKSRSRPFDFTEILSPFCELCKHVYDSPDQLLSTCIKCRIPLKYRCTTCNLLYSDIRVARQHLKSCTVPSVATKKKIVSENRRQKKLTCSLCCFSSNRRHLLERHIGAVHIIDRPFNCVWCGASFKLKEYLQKHRRVSRCGKRKPTLACEHCDFKCNRKNQSLQSHLEQSHPHLFPGQKCKLPEGPEV